MNRSYFLFPLLLLFLTPVLLSSTPHRFPQVQLPVMLAGQEISEYKALHYWDRYFDSTAVWSGSGGELIGGVTVNQMESALQDYLLTLWAIPYERAVAAQQRLMALAEVTAEADSSRRIYHFFTGNLERALYHPLSELRNEGLYAPVVESILRIGPTDGRTEEFYRRQLNTCRNNSPGTAARDFRFTDAGGTEHRLYDIRSEYTLLLFSNPGCPACKEVIDMLQPVMAAGGEEFTLLSIYIDQDLDEWRRGLQDYPEGWIVGYNADLSIRDKLVYDVRAIPSIYLLDKDKTVIFKDISPRMLYSLLFYR